MATPYLGELRIVAFNFAPKGWALCNGQVLAINQNQALFSLLGTTYGGNGQTTFALPNLQGRTPMHFGAGFTQGQVGGEQSHTLTAAELAGHTHLVTATSDAATVAQGDGKRFATSSSPVYAASPNVSMATEAVQSAGGSQPHPNMAPSLVLNVVIALTGIFPSQS